MCLFHDLLKKPRHKVPKKKPRKVKKRQLDELKHEIEMVILLSYDSCNYVDWSVEINLTVSCYTSSESKRLASFYPRDAMLARVLAVALCLSGCYKSMFCRNGWTDRAGFFGLQASFGLSYTVL